MSPILGIIASSNFQRVTNSYASIATTTVGSGGASSVTFSSIPATYTHLQIRIIAKTDRALNRDAVLVTFNSDTTSAYTRHGFYGDGSGVYAEGTSSYTTSMIAYRASGNSSATNIFGAINLDILDYANTNKAKTVRLLYGYDLNGSGEVGLRSNLWTNTSAITSIVITADSSTFAQYSSFALYGVK